MKLSQIFFNIRGFFLYYIQAKTRYNIQSPFEHHFVKEVLDTHKEYYCFSKIEKERKKLLQDSNTIEKMDFGAGSVFDRPANKIAIKNVASSSLSKNKQCRILFNLGLFTKASTILEIGTSLGISTSYLAAANPKSTVYTLEGNPQIAEQAKKVFDALGLKNIQQFTGTFAETLPLVLKKTDKLNLIFLDGHHDQKATLDYFERVLPKCSDQTILLVDDIYWSEGMNHAWQTIQAHKRVTLTVDIFTMGIVFFNPSLTKKNIKYINFVYKPWKVGLFGA